MAEEKPPSKISGWIKAVLTSVFGLVSGAALMYLTPLVNNVIKPGKPVPNFAQQISGLTVTFNNRSTGGTQGWWDFGDGTALEPFDPEVDTITHTYAQPGNYNVKLSLQNMLGEGSDRTVAVNLVNGQSATPTIDAFTAVPVDPNNNSAPAVFKILSEVKNAKLVAWELGKGFKVETNPTRVKLITLDEPGDYTLRLVAFNGDQVVEKSTQVFVGMYSSKPAATLSVVYDGVQVDRLQKTETFVLAWDPKHQGATCPVTREWAAPAGWTIAEAKYDPPAKNVIRNLKPEASTDRTRLRVSGELIKPKNVLTTNVAPPQCVVRVDMTLERRSAPVTRAADPVTFDLNTPGTTAMPLPPPPAGLDVQAKRIALQIKDGSKTIWKGPGLPAAAQVALQNRAMRVTAVEQGNQLRIDVVAPNPALPVSRPGP